MAETFILNVDDYAPGRYSRTKILQKAGFRVKEASTGAEALALAKEKPQLILLDVNLPDIAGFDVCRRIKLDPETSGIIVMHLSASSVTAEHTIAGLNGGADSYLTEPVPADVLVATIRALLRAHSAEANMRLANQRLQQFAAMISHELKEPLRGVSIFAELLKRKAAEKLNGDELRHLEGVQSSARVMNQRIDAILEYSRAEETSSVVEEVEAGETLAECVAELQLAITESRAQIHWGPLPRVRVNRTGLSRVFSNLITNAIKYKNTDDPVVTISATPREDGLQQFSVQDNGIGIDKNDHVRVFDPFTRLHGAELAGVGLGLALCWRVVTNCGGQMWVDSEPGKGSTFYFTLLKA